MALAIVAAPVDLGPGEPVQLRARNSAIVVGSGVIVLPEGTALRRGTMIGPVDAVKAYHAVLGRLGVRPHRPLEEDLKERPFATLRERCDYVKAISGLSVSRSTMCRAIARIGSTRKKGDKAPQSETNS